MNLHQEKKEQIPDSKDEVDFRKTEKICTECGQSFNEIFEPNKPMKRENQIPEKREWWTL